MYIFLSAFLVFIQTVIIFFVRVLCTFGYHVIVGKSRIWYSAVLRLIPPVFCLKCDRGEGVASVCRTLCDECVIGRALSSQRVA